MPNAAALTAEFVPRRQRPIAITLTIVCIPLGGVLAGLAAGQIFRPRLARVVRGRRCGAVGAGLLLLKPCRNRRASSRGGAADGPN